MVLANDSSGGYSQDIMKGHSQPKASLGQGCLIPRWFTYIAVGRMCQILAMSRRPQLLAIWASPEGHLCVLTTWQLASPETSDPKENKAEATYFS